MAVTLTLIASSSGSARLKLVIAIDARSPCEPEVATGPSKTANSMAALVRNAVRMAVKSSSAVSQTISNSRLASFSVAMLARQPPLPRVVTSASPASRFSVTSLTFLTSFQTGDP